MADPSEEIDLHEAIKTTAELIGKNIEGLHEEWTERPHLKNQVNAWKAQARPVANRLMNTVRPMAATVMNTVQPAASRFMSAASPAASRFMNVAVPAAATAMDAVRPMTSSIASAVGPAANTVSQAVKEAGRASIGVLGKAGRFIPSTGVLLRGALPAIAVIKGASDYIDGAREDNKSTMAWGLGDVLAGIASYSGIGTIPALAYADAKSIIKGDKEALDEHGLKVDDEDGYNALGMSPSLIKKIRANGAEGTRPA